jgi:hypothetical protein
MVDVLFAYNAQHVKSVLFVYALTYPYDRSNFGFDETRSSPSIRPVPGLHSH